LLGFLGLLLGALVPLGLTSNQWWPIAGMLIGPFVLAAVGRELLYSLRSLPGGKRIRRLNEYRDNRHVRSLKTRAWEVGGRIPLAGAIPLGELQAEVEGDLGTDLPTYVKRVGLWRWGLRLFSVVAAVPVFSVPYVASSEAHQRWVPYVGSAAAVCWICGAVIAFVAAVKFYRDNPLGWAILSFFFPWAGPMALSFLAPKLRVD
jgi:hypothetical protein